MKCLCAATRRAARLLTRHYEEHLRPCGLTPAQFELLGQLAGQPGVAQVELAERLGVDQTTLSRGLRLLVERQWVAREAAAGDRRLVRYRLTEAGVAGLREAIGYWRAAQEAVEAQLGAEVEAAWGVVERLSLAVETA